MASVICTICNKKPACVACHDCKVLVCKDCSATCQGCRISLCAAHTEQTKSGTKMCRGCMAEREARRVALRDKYANPTAISPAAPASPSAPSTSFQALGGDEIPTRPPEEFNDDDEVPGDETDSDDRIPPQERNEAFFTETGRLELPPMDENRPVLGASGYQPPSKTTMLIVLIFFGLAMIFTVRAVPSLEDTLFPFSDHEITFNKDKMAMITETNKLRDASNIQSLDIFAQSATFFIAWVFVILYGGGIFLLLVAVIRGLIWGRQTKTQREALESLDQNSKDLYL